MLWRGGSHIEDRGDRRRREHDHEHRGDREGAENGISARDLVRSICGVATANGERKLRQVIEALRLDIADLVVPKDLAERPQAEQDLRKELLEALEATIKEFDEN